MHIILLSGGSGKRLWPLSNDIRSKQFIKFFKNVNGVYESMLQRAYYRIRKIDSKATVIVATEKSQVSTILNQIGTDVEVSVEPCRRDTFPAIVLASLYLKDIKKVNEDEVVVVCPVDAYVGDEYFEALKRLAKQVEKGKSNIVLMGIEPTYPSEKYGYIITSTNESVSEVESFKEKPNKEMADMYIKRGALWNGGVFAYKLGYIIKKAIELININNYSDLYEKYACLPKISFDYAVVENERKIEVMKFKGIWKDIGTWNTLTESIPDLTTGNAIIDNSCDNVHVINETDIPVLAMGLKDIVIAASPEGILVSDKEKTSKIKPFVEKIEQQVMFAEKSWGTFRILQVGNGCMTVKLAIKSGQMLNYHSHRNRNEVWICISGTGQTIVDGVKETVNSGDVVAIRAGCKHTVKAITELQLIEIQLGNEISSGDKIKYKLEL